MTHPEISLIVPAYNEEENIFHTLLEITNVFSKTNIEYEIVVVDDGSCDSTLKEIERAKAKNSRIVGISQINGGKGSAIHTGFKYCSGKFISFIDADLDIHPQQIPLYYSLIQRMQADVVVGSKRHHDSQVCYPITRKILSIGYQTLICILFNLNVRDTQVGLKLFKYNVLADSLPYMQVKKFAFDLELLVIATQYGYKIIEAPINLDFQRFESRINYQDIKKIFIDTIGIYQRSKKLSNSRDSKQ